MILATGVPLRIPLSTKFPYHAFLMHVLTNDGIDYSEKHAIKAKFRKYKQLTFYLSGLIVFLDSWVGPDLG